MDDGESVVRVLLLAVAVTVVSLSILVTLPTNASAYTLHAPILIDGDFDFTAANGVTGGNGGWDNPYIIEGWEINASATKGIAVNNATARFIIRDTLIQSDGSLATGIYIQNSANGRVEAAKVFNCSDTGIAVWHSTNITVISSTLSSTRYMGINAWNSTNVTIASNTVSNGTYGITLSESANVTIASNTISNSFAMGLHIETSVNVSLTSNTFHNDGVWLGGPLLQHYNSHTITTDNTVNGLPLYYHKDCDGLTVDGIPIGELIVVNCTHVNVSNLTIVNTDMGIFLGIVSDVVVSRNTVSDSHIGIGLVNCTNSSVIQNSVSDNYAYGIAFGASANVTVRSNLIVNTAQLGLSFYLSSHMLIASNNISENGLGIFMEYSDNATVQSNIISENPYLGIELHYMTNALVHHNDIVDNTNQSRDDEGPENSWDNGYPRGGNYWSNYSGVDLFSGPNQNVAGSDGIGDTPFIIDGDSMDRYPLMQPVIVDNEPPSVTIANPANDTTVGSRSQVFFGTATDNVAVSSVKVRVMSGSWINATGTDSWSATLTLTPGYNKIEAQSFDAVGNPSALSSVDVFYDNENPTVTLVCNKTSVEAGSTVTCTVAATDNRGIPSLSWAVKKGGFDVTSGTQGTVTFVASEAGDYVVEATAADSVGNSGTANQTITAEEKPSDAFPWIPVFILIVVLIIMIVIIVLIKRRKPKESSKEEASDASPPR